MPTPFIIERQDGVERFWDMHSRLLRDRIILIAGPIEDYNASLICMQLLFLESENPTKPVELYINSPGGVVSAGLAIYDTMNHISCPVLTLCLGQAASMGAILLSAGTPGLRYALPNSRIMVHQPHGGYQGQASDILIHADEVARLREILNGILARTTGQPLAEIQKMTERDTFFSADEAKEVGLVDWVVS